MPIKVSRHETTDSAPFVNDLNNLNSNNVASRAGQRARITIPGDQIRDYVNSDIVFRMQVECTENDASTNPVLLPVTIGDLVTIAGDDRLGNTGVKGLIRNAEVRYPRTGETLKSHFQNVVRTNLDHYSKSRQEILAEQYNGLSTAAQNGGDDLAYGLPQTPFFRYSVCTDYDASVTELSRFVEEEVRIPYGDIDPLGRVLTQSPDMLIGDKQVLIEFENTIDVAHACPSWLVDEDGADAPISVADVTASGSEIGTPLTLDEVTYDSLDDFRKQPVYVGMPITLSYTDSGGDQSHDTTISAMQISSTDNKLKVYLATPAPTAGATDNVTDLSLLLRRDNPKVYAMINEVYAETHDHQLPQDVVQKTLSSMLKNGAKIPFIDMLVTTENMQGTTHYSETLLAEPNSLGVALLTPRNGELLSTGDNATKYRWQVDGKPVLDRDIAVGNLRENNVSLHNLLCDDYLSRFGYDLKKYESPIYNYVNYVERLNSRIYPLPLMPDGNRKVVNIDIFSDPAMQAKRVYYVQPLARALVLSNNKVQFVNM